MVKNSAEWAKAVKAVACHKCQFCGSAEKLEAHHIRPRCDFPSLTLCVDNGVCLCHKCHVKAHGGSFFRPRGVAGNITPHNLHGFTIEEIAAVRSFVASLIGK